MSILNLSEYIDITPEMHSNNVTEDYFHSTLEDEKGNRLDNNGKIIKNPYCFGSSLFGGSQMYNYFKAFNQNYYWWIPERNDREAFIGFCTNYKLKGDVEYRTDNSKYIDAVRFTYHDSYKPTNFRVEVSLDGDKWLNLLQVNSDIFNNGKYAEYEITYKNAEERVPYNFFRLVIENPNRDVISVENISFLMKRPTENVKEDHKHYWNDIIGKPENATVNTDGFMSRFDKRKLDKLSLYWLDPVKDIKDLSPIVKDGSTCFVVNEEAIFIKSDGMWKNFSHFVSGDMKREIYDKNLDGVVDLSENAIKLNGKTAEEYVLKNDFDLLKNKLDSILLALSLEGRVVDTFTATEGQTIFTLSKVPNKNKVIMIINGLSYFEDVSFKVEREYKRVIWYPLLNGFDIGKDYEIAISYNIDNE